MRLPTKHTLIVAVVLLPFGVMTGCDAMLKDILETAVNDVAVRDVSLATGDQLNATLDQINQQCPIKMDAFTTLQRVEVIDDANVDYIYSVNQRGAKRIGNVKTRDLQAAVIEQIKGSVIAVAIADQGLVVRHLYRDESGGELLSYVIDRSVLEGNLDMLGQDHANPFAAPTATNVSLAGAIPVTDDPPRERGADKVSSSSENRQRGDDAVPFEPEADWAPKDLTPEKSNEPQPWRIQSNPFFEP